MSEQQANTKTRDYLEMVDFGNTLGNMLATRDNSSLLTVRQLADQVRASVSQNIGRADFARKCMDFDYRVCEAARNEVLRLTQADHSEDLPDEETGKLDEVFRLLAFQEQWPTPGRTAAQVAEDVQLSMCWLDAKGYGQLSLATLGDVLERARREYFSG